MKSYLQGYAVILFLLFSLKISYSQVIDSFTDGDFGANPTWVGNTTHWSIITDSDISTGVTGSNTLRLSAESSNEINYLSTQHSSWGTQQSWGFWIGRSESATDNNRSFVWLWANESDLLSNTVDGYRISFGDNSGIDQIFLESVTDGTVTTILTSSGGTTNGISDFGFLVRVTRDEASNWSIYTSTLPTENGSGALATDEPNSTNTNIFRGGVNDNTYTDFSNGYFGFMVRNSTGVGSRTNAEFDQLYFVEDASAFLPVELISFTANVIDKNVTLKWKTSTEVNNYGFQVEHSVDNIDWQNISFVPGHGNSNIPMEYSFADYDLQEGKYFYRLKEIDNDGKFTYSQTIEIKIVSYSTSFTLEQNYPNPFNPVTTIKFSIPETVHTLLKVYDVLGNEVETLFNATAEGGKFYYIDFDALKYSSGIYYYLISAGDYHEVKKMIMTK